MLVFITGSLQSEREMVERTLCAFRNLGLPLELKAGEWKLGHDGKCPETCPEKCPVSRPKCLIPMYTF